MAEKPAFRVRPEGPSDREAVFAVQRAAFGRDAEARLVDALRASARPRVSLVAEDEGGRVVGHVFFSPVAVDAASGDARLAMGLAPVGVLPAWQGRGVGDALCREGLAACRVLGASLVFVLGHPDYYPRFGFAPAGPRGFRYGERDAGPAFMLLELAPGAADGWAGPVRYLPAFEELS